MYLIMLYLVEEAAWQAFKLKLKFILHTNEVILYLLGEEKMADIWKASIGFYTIHI